MGTVYDGFDDMSDEEIEDIRERERHEEEIYNLTDDQIDELMDYHGE